MLIVNQNVFNRIISLIFPIYTAIVMNFKKLIRYNLYIKRKSK